MEKWYAIRDAFFWWAGVWATVTLGNRAIGALMGYSEQRKSRNYEDEEPRKGQSHEEYQREFMDNMQKIHAEEMTDNQPETVPEEVPHED